MIEVTSRMAAAFEDPLQRPAFKVESFDVSTATGEPWARIIDGTFTQSPVDLTPFVSQLQWSYDKVSVTLGDESLRFHPDSGDLAVSLCPGHIIRITEGDTTVPEVEWVTTFSGLIQGPYSWKLQRGTLAKVEFNVYTRNANQAWSRRNVTGKEFTVGSDWGNMFFDLVENVMGLEPAEINVGRGWGIMFDKTSNQIVNTPPWEVLTNLAQGNMQRIWFNGKGQVSAYSFVLGSVTANLPNDKIVSYSQPSNDQEIINKVSVEYIDNELSKVTGGRQTLGTANITAGFYDFETKLDVFYSDDKKQQAENVKLIVKKSINQNGLGISVGSENLDIKDEFGGELVIHVDAWVSALATAGIAAVLASAAIPDIITSAGVGGGVGASVITVTSTVTNPIGTTLQISGIISVMLAMMILGNGVYEIVGNPIEYAFLEKKAVALIDNIKFWEEKEQTFRQEFISTEEHAHQLALNELLFFQSQGHARTLRIHNNPRIEVGDTLLLDTGVKFFVTSASKTLARGGGNLMTLNGFRSLV